METKQQIHCLFASQSHAVMFFDSITVHEGESPLQTAARAEAALEEIYTKHQCFTHIIKLVCWSESQLNTSAHGLRCYGDTYIDTNAVDYAYNFIYFAKSSLEALVFNQHRLKRMLETGANFYTRPSPVRSRSKPLKQPLIELTQADLEQLASKARAEFQDHLSVARSFLAIFGREHQLQELENRLVSNAHERFAASLARQAR
jgi:hypothetical protein